jgi:hypothetical protein
MEKLLYQKKLKSRRWIFKGIEFSEKNNGWTFDKPSIALTFSSNICIIPDRLLPSRACFRLYKHRKNNTIKSTIENNDKNSEIDLFNQKNYFCKPISGLKMTINLYRKISINV